MSITDDLQQLAQNTPIGCKVCYYLSVMGDKDSENMDKALKPVGKKSGKPVWRYQHTELADIFTRNAMPISESAIRRHRKHCA